MSQKGDRQRREFALERYKGIRYHMVHNERGCYLCGCAPMFRADGRLIFGGGRRVELRKWANR